MEIDDTRFKALSDDDKAKYVAGCLGCNTADYARPGWPIGLIGRLISTRMNEGPKAFYEQIGRALSPH